MKTYHIAAAAKPTHANTAIASLVEVHELRDKVHTMNNILMMSDQEIAEKLYLFLWNESLKGTRGLKDTPWSVTIKHESSVTYLTKLFDKVCVFQRRKGKIIYMDDSLNGIYQAIEYILDSEVKRGVVEIKE